MSKPPIKQKYIKDPDDLLEAWNLYKEYLDANPDKQEHATGKGVVVTTVKKPYQRKGFESFFYNTYGFHVHQYIDNHGNAYEPYLGVVTHMRNEWEADQIEGTITGRYKAPNLVCRINSITEKTENKTEISGSIMNTLIEQGAVLKRKPNAE